MSLLIKNSDRKFRKVSPDESRLPTIGLELLDFPTHREIIWTNLSTISTKGRWSLVSRYVLYVELYITRGKVINNQKEVKKCELSFIL